MTSQDHCTWIPDADKYRTQCGHDVDSLQEAALTSAGKGESITICQFCLKPVLVKLGPDR